MEQRKLNSIQSLRGVAALMVCMMHIYSDNPQQAQLFLIFKRILMSIGGYGVDLFFTISGFIITWIVMKENKLPSLRVGIIFLIKRFMRIYPLFWVTLFFFSVLLILFPNYSAASTITLEKLLYYKVLILLTPTIPLQYAAWTLPFEVYFYFTVFCFICIFPKKYFLPFFCGWALIHALIIYGNILGFTHSHYFVFGNQQILEFFGGLLAGYLLSQCYKHTITDKYICLVVAITLLSIGFITSYIRNSIYYLNHIESFIYLGVSASLLIYALVGLEINQRIHPPKLLHKLGDISYSIYLWHFPIISIITILTMKYAIMYYIPIFIRSSIGVVVVLLISKVSYRYIERPFIILSHRLSDNF